MSSRPANPTQTRRSLNLNLNSRLANLNLNSGGVRMRATQPSPTLEIPNGMVKLNHSLSLFRANELVGTHKRKRSGGGSSPDDNRALLKAAQDGNVLELFNVLTLKNADADAQDADGMTALMHVARSTWPRFGRVRSSDKEKWDEGYVACVVQLLEAGADPNSKDLRKRTALSYAAEYGKINRLKTLLENGANPNILDVVDETALMHSLDVAVQATNRLKCVNALLENGATPNQQRDDGSTALILAARREFFPCLDALLEKGADPNLPDRKGSTALIWAARATWNKNAAYASCLKLLAVGAETNRKNHFKRTALSYAASSGKARILKALLKHGADPNLADDEGSTALDWAKRSQRTECIQILENAAAKENQTDSSELDDEP